ALPLPLLLRALLPPLRDTGPALRVPWAARLATISAPSGLRRSTAGQPWLAWLGWALLWLAAARPLAWGEVVQPPHSPRELKLDVHLSGSAGEGIEQVGDEVVCRLDAARAVIAGSLNRREGDRVGLLVYGRGAYVQPPDSADLGTVREQLLATEFSLGGG